ncbi:tubulin epsilon and delta complex protein 1 isoform X4 [Symphalangus syndactylus]|uniref:tubulin epsilon and delta complex protein 1 isoform X4 n=1 Tax=Symphalangus syndactylus TaxID=9590 RepID=UPI0024417866|nr:tubulin epsilon and delta complex protein 1 isoform X4 [Symphalangus syndactylus]
MGRRRQRVDLAAGARAGALPEAIAALSRSLPSGPSPEIFRRAKFDRPEATSALWQLLYRVLSPLPAGNALASLALEVQARLVKSALCSQGYPRLALAQLPEDGSQGSRELLLALSWLLARGPVPEQMLAQARVPLGDEMTVCQCEALASPGPPAPHMEAEGPVDVRHVQWLMGKLRFRWRQLVSSQQEQCALLSKLLRTLEHENQRLEAVLAWRRTELVFWRWMDTVLGTCSLEVPAAASQPTFLPWVPERGGGELELIMRELQALEEELQEAAERRRAAWEAKAGGCGRGPEWSAARRASREAVERELGALQRCWEQDRGPAQPHGPHRLVRREDGAAGDRDLRAAEVIRRLRSQEACLEAVLHRLQGQCQQELARLAGALPGFIWILPPGR